MASNRLGGGWSTKLSDEAKRLHDEFGPEVACDIMVNALGTAKEKIHAKAGFELVELLNRLLEFSIKLDDIEAEDVAGTVLRATAGTLCFAIARSYGLGADDAEDFRNYIFTCIHDKLGELSDESD